MNDVVKKTLISVPKNINSEYIFCAKDGRPFYNVRKSFATALKDAEINDFTFHGLRHSYASHLVMSGIDLMTVKELLGHKSIEMTMRYSHLAAAHKQHAVEILEKNLGTNWAQTHIDENSDFERLIASVENKGVIERAPVAQMDRAQVS